MTLITPLADLEADRVPPSRHRLGREFVRRKRRDRGKPSQNLGQVAQPLLPSHKWSVPTSISQSNPKNRPPLPKLVFCRMTVGCLFPSNLGSIRF
jgi:hypothetical protein